jgi:predicted RNA-binding Zn-ribbon protein involved in translation (DUF1610 family)
MKPDDKVVILCKKTSDLADPGPDATRGNCWKCGAEVWVGPNSRRRMREFSARLYCTICGLEITNGEKAGVFGTAEQLLSLTLEALEKDVDIDLKRMISIDDPDEFLRNRK